MRLRPCARESGSVRLRSQTGTDRPTVHSGSSLSAPVWLRYPYQRGTDKKNGAVWLRSIWLPCEPTDRIQKKVQIGNEANFVHKRGLSTFFVFWFMASWNVDVKYAFIPNWIHLDLLPCARKLFWLRSRVHAGKILDQIQKRTEPYVSALMCTGP